VAVEGVLLAVPLDVLLHWFMRTSAARSVIEIVNIM
jgi:hypothetical protein